MRCRRRHATCLGVRKRLRFNYSDNANPQLIREASEPTIFILHHVLKVYKYQFFIFFYQKLTYINIHKKLQSRVAK